MREPKLTFREFVRTIELEHAFYFTHRPRVVVSGKIDPVRRKWLLTRCEEEAIQRHFVGLEPCYWHKCPLASHETGPTKLFR